MDPTGGESPMWKQPDEYSGERSEMTWIDSGRGAQLVEADWEKREASAAASQRKSPSGLKLATNKNMQNAEAGKTGASVSEAGRLEESVTETGRPEEALAEVWKAVVDEFGKRLAMMDSVKRDSSKKHEEYFESVILPLKTPKEAQEDLSGMISEMQPVAEEPLRVEAKAKKPDSKQQQQQKKTQKSRECADDSIGSYELGERSYEGVTFKEATKLHKKHLEQLAKKNMKNLKKVKDEDARKAVASVTDAVRPKNSLTEAGKAESTAKETKEKPGKRSEMPITVKDCYSGMRPEYREKLMKNNEDRAAERHALLANFKKLAESNRKKLLESNRKKLSESKRSGNSAGDDSFIGDNKPAEPSATISMGQYSVQDDLDHDRGISAAKVAKKMACEAESFALYRSCWESEWRKTCGLFTNITVLSSMQFTHCTPGYSPCSSSCSTPEILQIYSVKLARHVCGLDFPLSVYGVVAVRDTVDRNRNILFSRDISKAQKLTENDPFLHLIGPSRAIVNTDEVWIEVELKVPGASPKDNALFSLAHRYTGETSTGSSTIILNNVFCTLELCLQQVEQTVQATILGVQVVKDDWSWPFEYGGLVACSPLSEETQSPDSGSSNNLQIVLINSKGEAIPKGSGGYIHLRRQVVSVKRQGVLDLVIKAYSQSGAIAEETCARFLPKDCNISQKICVLGDARVTITVAWSHVAMSKMGDALENCGKSATPLAKKTAAEDMTYEAQEFASYRTLWESKWRETCGLFTDKTVLSSMLFTHYTPARSPYSIQPFLFHPGNLADLLHQTHTS